MCLEVDIAEVIVEDISNSRVNSTVNTKNWCIELNYVDYTGEQGFACVWLVGPSEQGEYSVSKGPIFNVKCAGSR